MTHENSLYTIRGPFVCQNEEVAHAMAWLEAQPIGRYLLGEAVAKQNRPVSIVVTGDEHTSRRRGTSLVFVNPWELEQPIVEDAHGVLHPCSIERALAHELVHVAQPHELSALSVAADEIYDPAVADRDREMLRCYQRCYEPLRDAVEAAPDFAAAYNIVLDHINHELLPIEMKFRQTLLHSRYPEYIEKVETPAIAADNVIAAIRGEPLRSYHAVNLDITADQLRERLSRGLVAELHLENKRIAPWVMRIQGDSGLVQEQGR